MMNNKVWTLIQKFNNTFAKEKEVSNSYRLDQIYVMLLRNDKARKSWRRSFRVTPTTIRRDLLILEERQLIYRSRGMAFVRGIRTTPQHL